MTQVHPISTGYDDEVLRVWGHQASQLQAAYEAAWYYLEDATCEALRHRREEEESSR
ncbi:hypothetical protein ACOJCM_08300 [Billgrantia sp. LNSP4103-1]|uniref:hypothetical protein n=1 Tax=Billgrantia sp. LNSP4103-1 TaxID=3410266 RepID=UPI00403F8256